MPAISMVTHNPPPLSILAAEFPVKLSAFNELTRDLRSCGIELVGLKLADNQIQINAESVDLLSRRFGHELRSIRYSTTGKLTRSTVTIRGVDVIWYGPLKEQDR
jgi:hypothetical protein